MFWLGKRVTGHFGPKTKGWDRDETETSRSRDRSMVWSRCSAHTSRFRLSLSQISVSTLQVLSPRPIFTQIILWWFEPQPSKTHSNRQQLFHAECRTLNVNPKWIPRSDRWFRQHRAEDWDEIWHVDATTGPIIFYSVVKFLVKFNTMTVTRNEMLSFLKFEFLTTCFTSQCSLLFGRSSQF